MVVGVCGWIVVVVLVVVVMVDVDFGVDLSVDGDVDVRGAWIFGIDGCSSNADGAGLFG